MSATRGFWPGEAPAAEEEEAQDGESWPEPRAEESESEVEPVLGEAAVAEVAEAEPESEEPEVVPRQHVPGELQERGDHRQLEQRSAVAEVRAGVRRTALRHAVRTDSSARFEKSLDPHLPPCAVAMAWAADNTRSPNQ